MIAIKEGNTGTSPHVWIILQGCSGEGDKEDLKDVPILFYVSVVVAVSTSSPRLCPYPPG